MSESITDKVLNLIVNDGEFSKSIDNFLETQIEEYIDNSSFEDVVSRKIDRTLSIDFSERLIEIIKNELESRDIKEDLRHVVEELVEDQDLPDADTFQKEIDDLENTVEEVAFTSNANLIKIEHLEKENEELKKRLDALEKLVLAANLNKIVESANKVKSVLSSVF